MLVVWLGAIILDHRLVASAAPPPPTPTPEMMEKGLTTAPDGYYDRKPAYLCDTGSRAWFSTAYIFSNSSTNDREVGYITDLEVPDSIPLK